MTQKKAALVELKPRLMSLEEDRKKRSQAPFLLACHCKKTPYTPVWLMRQAGRYMKEYRDIRSQVSFLELCKNKELVAQVTIDAARKLHVDAAIIFSDILLVLEPFGFFLDYVPGGGPMISEKKISCNNLKAIEYFDPTRELSYVLEAIQFTRQCLDENIPLIGFSGAPFTLLAYILEGGSSKQFSKIKKFMYQDFQLWDFVMRTMTKVIRDFLRAQVRSGVDAVQIFDSWVGCLSGEEYEKYVLPYMKELICELNLEVPVIHFGTGTGAFLETFASAGGDVISVDHRVNLCQGWRRIGNQFAIQGNLDPAHLCLSKERLFQEIDKVLEQVKGQPGYVFNLGHGILPQTPVENVIALVDYVHSRTSQ